MEKGAYKRYSTRPNFDFLTPVLTGVAGGAAYAGAAGYLSRRKKRKSRRNPRRKVLEVFKDGKWQMVFCYNTWDTRGPIVTTTDPRKALGARDFEYFQNRFYNHQFRVVEAPKISSRSRRNPRFNAGSATTRRLPAAQERVLLRYYAVGEPGKHTWPTIKALIKKGYLVERDQRLRVTPKGKEYCDKYHMEIRLNSGARVVKRYPL